MAGSLLEAPYLEPAPLTSYEVFSDDAIFIELGEPIDPQGGEVETTFILGQAESFLSPLGSNLAKAENSESVPSGSYIVEVKLRSEFEG